MLALQGGDQDLKAVVAKAVVGEVKGVLSFFLKLFSFSLEIHLLHLTHFFHELLFELLVLQVDTKDDLLNGIFIHVC